MDKTLQLRKELGKILARERKKRRLTQNELAIKMDKHEKYISMIENGRVNITFDYLQLIIKHLDCEVEDVLNINKNQETQYNRKGVIETVN